MPEISRFYGITIYMLFREHNPPHFHAKYQGYEVSITIDDGIVKGEMPKRALNLIFDWLEIHREELMQNWNTIQDTGEFLKIDPLK